MIFDIDIWQEIFSTIRKNKLRTFLTGFSVATGIFMLVVLLGASNGLKNGVTQNFEDEASNSIHVYGGLTTKAYKGQNPGKRIRLDINDYSNFKKRIIEIDEIAARTWVPGDESISYNMKFGNFVVRPVHCAYKHLIKYDLQKGRMLNEKDEEQRRKVVVIQDKIEEALFENQDPIGEYIEINGLRFKVVGVYGVNSQENNSGIIYMPITTADIIFHNGGRVNEIGFTLGNLNYKESEKIEDKLTMLLAGEHMFDPSDKAALWIDNNIEDTKDFISMFSAIDTGIWIIGVFTLVLGVIGVFNIMLIVVKERTKEIGVRKAIGATPASIVWLILFESILITAFAGYSGLFFGISLLEVVSQFNLIEALSEDVALYFVAPHVDMNVAVGATILLVITGAIAGLVPARRAAKIRPVLALREE